MEALLYVLYDGPCALCQGVVRLALRQPGASRCRFVPLQAVVDTPAGDQLAGRLGERLGESVVVLRGSEILVRSDAALALLEALGPWAWLARRLRCLPRAWRDALYEAVAARRARLFGRYEAPLCERLSPAHRSRLLDALPPEALAALLHGVPTRPDP